MFETSFFEKWLAAENLSQT